jgi:methionine synthase II (cobalamin-independent)
MPRRRVGRSVPIAYLGGIAARSERYMRDHWGAAKGFVSPAALLASARQEEADHVAVQQAAGLDLLAPALVRWEDLLRPLLKDGSGATVGQVFRYFETNTFFRQPLVTGTLAAAEPRAWFEAFAIPKGRAWVLTLPSPYDFAVRAKDERRTGTVADLAADVAAVLRPVVAAAVQQGAALVRFHDPSIAYGRATARDVDAFADGLAAAAKGHESLSTLHVTNGDPFSVPEALMANPLGGLSIEDPGRAPPKGLTLPSRTRLSVAVLRGEQSLVEEPRAAAESAAALAQRLGLEPFGLTNGWDLDHVPHAIAVRKVQALGQARTLLAEVTA